MNPGRSIADFSSGKTKARRQRDDILKVLNGKKNQTRVLYIVKPSLKNVGKINTFPDKQR